MKKRILAIAATLCALLTMNCVVVKADSAETTIANRILKVNPHKSEKYAHKIAHYIVQSAHRNKVSPYAVAALAWQESEYSTHNMMQVTDYSVRHKYKHLNPNNIKDNIEIGTRYFAENYHKLPSRGGYNRMTYALGRYNGCGPRGHYVKRVVSKISRIVNNDPSGEYNSSHIHYHKHH